MKYFILLVTVSMLLAQGIKAQDLDSFGADLGKKSVFGKEIRIPYTDLISYYGYIKPGSTPDEEKGGKKYYYLYLWITAASPEIGIRMISPIPSDMKPEKTDFTSDDYLANTTDKTSYFDTWISFEKAGGVTSIDDILSKGKDAVWTSIGQNDDSGEMPKQPSGNKYNSLMRLKSDVDNPLKALTTGLYRIGFTTYKTGEVKGGFLAQIGSPIKIPGVMIAKNLDSLKAYLGTK